MLWKKLNKNKTIERKHECCFLKTDTKVEVSDKTPFCSDWGKSKR